jgi:formylglycine-generating enzyme required for sulfatase activity
MVESWAGRSRDVVLSMKRPRWPGAFPTRRWFRALHRLAQWHRGPALLGGVSIAGLTLALPWVLTGPPSPQGAPVFQTGTNPVDGAEMVWVPPGTFQRGVPEGEADERPVHTVRLTSGFWMYRTEVTTAQWDRFLRSNPGHQQPKYAAVPRLMRPSQPAVAISWEDAVAYCRWARVRLPTEAEWEYAAGGPEGRRYPWGNGEPDGRLAVFYRSISLGHPDPVGSRPAGASPFGILDMAGSVWEWCSDWYGPYSSHPQVDPTGPAPGNRRVVRGGGWINEMEKLRTTVRGHGLPTRRSGHIGFRPVSEAEGAR